MADVFSPEKRSQVMQKIRSKNTKPEIVIRQAIHRLGYRFRLHDKSLPGNPDIIMPKYHTVIQVRGCFWHGHDCKDGHIPKSRKEYWEPKIRATIERDEKNDHKLRKDGWKLIIVWECQCMTKDSLTNELMRIANLLTVV